VLFNVVQIILENRYAWEAPVLRQLNQSSVRFSTWSGSLEQLDPRIESLKGKKKTVLRICVHTLSRLNNSYLLVTDSKV
jgi:hypothetical protein